MISSILGVMKEIGKLMPQLEKLRLVAEWTLESLLAFLQELEPNRSIICLDVTLPFDVMLHNSRLLIPLLRNSCTNNTALKSLRLALYKRGQEEARPRESAPLFEAVASALSRNPASPRLEIKNLAIPDIDWLVDFLLRDITPRDLKFTNLRLLDSTTVLQKDKPDRNPSISKLESLKIGSPKSWVPFSFNYLLSQLSEHHLQLPALLSLDITNESRYWDEERRLPMVPDVPVSLVKFLQSALRVESLMLRGFIFDHERLCQTLQQHWFLRTLFLEYPDMQTGRKPDQFYLELLKNHNATLTTLHYRHMENPLIAYYLKLNLLGRATVRSSSITRGRLIRMLELALTSRVHFHYELEKHSVLYDLLRESAGSWSVLTRPETPKLNACWTTVATANTRSIGNKTPVGEVQLQWLMSTGLWKCVIGRISLQRFTTSSQPLFRITFRGKYALHSGQVEGPAQGALYLPADVSDVKWKTWQTNGHNVIEMVFSATGDGLDSITIFIPGHQEASNRTGRLFLQALISADEERRRYISAGENIVDDAT
jgi:hypothetical protein